MLVQFLGERLLKGRKERQTRRFIFGITIVFSTAAYGQSNCQCDPAAWEGSCEAEIIVAGDSALISTDTKQCAKVDWYLNGDPRISVVADGEIVEPILVRHRTVKLSIQSCKICDADKAGSSPTSEAPLLPKVTVDPMYPARAMSRGLEGYVDLSFTVTARGTVANPIVVRSSSSAFERIAIRAILKYQFEPQTRDGHAVDTHDVTTRIEFKLD